MTDSKPPGVGEISWADLTVADAPGIRPMGAYSDFCLNAPRPAPPSPAFATRAAETRISRRDGPRSMGGGARYAVIRDLAGAVAALYQQLV